MSRDPRPQTKTTTLDAEQQAFAEAVKDRHFATYPRDPQAIEALLADLRRLIMATPGPGSPEHRELRFSPPRRDVRSEQAMRAAAKKIENRTRRRHSR